MTTENYGHTMYVRNVVQKYPVIITTEEIINHKQLFKGRSGRKGSIRVTSSQGILQNANVAQLIEHRPSKSGVVSLNLIIRSRGNVDKVQNGL
jgi:hypothetical protein